MQIIKRILKMKGRKQSPEGVEKRAIQLRGKPRPDYVKEKPAI